MQVKFGKRTMVYGTDELAELRDANDLLDDRAALLARLDEDGYLLLRDLIDRDAVLSARQRILQHMDEQQALVPGRLVLEGAMPQGGRSVPMMGCNSITQDALVTRVLEAPELFALFEQLFAEPPLTFDYKWLRAVGNEQFTGAHYDVVYMGNGSKRLHTTWIPLGDIPVEQGTLAMCVGSHRDARFEKLRQTYGKMDVDRDLIQGWFTEDPFDITTRFGGQWQTTNFRAGDVMIFGMYAMHASTTNTTDRFRLSCDVRYQPSSDPVDARWCGRQPHGHLAWGNKGVKIKSMADARAEWGV